MDWHGFKFRNGRQYQLLESQFWAKDEQIEKLQSAMDQAQQLQLIHTTELAQMRSRSLRPQLRAVFVVDWQSQVRLGDW